MFRRGQLSVCNGGNGKQSGKLTVLLGIFFILNIQSSDASTFYFSNSKGNDGYTSVQAQNIATPWKTLSKLNSIMPVLKAGDSICFKRGDIFDGSFVVTRSGISGKPITFCAYGDGNKPVITGLTQLWNWNNTGNGIYESACATEPQFLIMNGAVQQPGRFPNSGYLSYESHILNNSITDKELTSATNWSGAELVIRKNRWTIDKSLIIAHNGSTLLYASGNPATPTDNYGYFIQKSLKTLDMAGEWYFDTQKKTVKVFFGSKSPSASVIRVNAYKTLISVTNQNYLTFSGLAIIGSGENAFHLINSSNVNIDNCFIDYSGVEAILASYSANLKVENVYINHSLSGGVNLDAGCKNAVITGTTIKNIALFAGSGKSGSGTYEGITSFGDNTRIEKNVIDSVGYNGIYFGGNSTLVKNNFITNFCLVKDDGAGIYVGDWSKTANKKIINNILLNGVGNGDGTNAPNLKQAEGIYIDDNSESVTVTGNTMSKCSNNGLKLHNAQYINISNNVVYDNGAQLRLEQDHYISTSSYLRNNIIRQNTFFSKTNTQPTAKFSSQQDDIVVFGNLDSNFYCRPIDELATISTSIVRGQSYINQDFDLDTWKNAYGKDQYSNKSPKSIPLVKINGVKGSNLFSNGAFQDNITNVFGYSTINNLKLDYATGLLDGGSLRISASAAANNQVIINLKTGKLTAGQKYVLRFSMKDYSGGSMKVYLRKTGAPYTTISNQRTLSQSKNARSENEAYFTCTANESDASIILDIDQFAGQLFIDNIQLYEADLEETRPDEFLRFEYNASDFNKTVSLDKTYVDVYNRTYTGSFNLLPYTSIVLIATESAINKTAQTISFNDLDKNIVGTPLVTVTPVASSGLPVNLKIASGPATITDNVLKFEGYGITVLEAIQPGNELFEQATAKLTLTTVKPDVVEADLSTKLIAYPNPFYSKLTVELTIPHTGKGLLLMYDLQGKLISQLYSGILEGGEKREFSINAEGLDLKPGMYLIRLVTDETTLYQKVILVK